MKLYLLRSARGVRDGSLTEPVLDSLPLRESLQKAGMSDTILYFFFGPPTVPGYWDFWELYTIRSLYEYVPKQVQVWFIQYWTRVGMITYGISWNSSIVYAHEAIREAAEAARSYTRITFIVVAAALVVVDQLITWYGHARVTETSLSWTHLMRYGSRVWGARYYGHGDDYEYVFKRLDLIGDIIAGEEVNPDWASGGPDHWSFLGMWRAVFRRWPIWHVYHWESAVVNFMGLMDNVDGNLYVLQEGYARKLKMPP